jgi:hypothetical protein
MGRNSNPNAGSFLAWLDDPDVKARMSRLLRNLGLDKKR